MNIKIHKKMIKEMCGIVSFKRGDTLFRANKVVMEEYSSDYCKAKIKGSEDFHVIIYVKSNELMTNCSCPKLASFQRECQHVAAVLLAIYNHQRKESNPIVLNEPSMKEAPDLGLTEGLLKLFHENKRTSGHQLHFEKRETLKVEFICTVLSIGDGNHVFGIQVIINDISIQNIRDFLEHVKKREPINIAADFKYDPLLHCFLNETDAVLQKLMVITQDEKLYSETIDDKADFDKKYDHILIIPPSIWNTLMPLLINVPFIKLMYDGNTFDGIQFLNEPMPLRFDFSGTKENENIHLKVNNIDRLIIFRSYQFILNNGKIAQFSKEDMERLIALKQMLNSSQSNQIRIPPNQFKYFQEKVIPGLKRLGEVHISEEVSKQFSKTTLVAKLYLDRVNNKLLAGLEFQYENIVINPLETNEPQLGSMIIRDVEKEDAILQLMRESKFTQTDGGYFMHNEDLEYEFLYYIVPKLQKLVQIYATTAVRNRIYKGNLRPRIRVKPQKERTNWLEFKFEMDGIAEREIREILSALEEKRKYYRLRNGMLFSLESREFDEVKQFLDAVSIKTEELVSGIHLSMIQSVKALNSVEDRDIFTLEKSFREFLENRHSHNQRKFAVPKNVESILRNYQIRGYEWMKTLSSYGFGGILADDMGLGKTLQSIAFILSELPNIRKRKSPVLIVCPSSLTYNWLSEMLKFAPELQTIVVDGTKKERITIQKSVSEMDVVITSYSLLRSDIQWYEKQSFHTVFFDEAQAFKNPLTQTAKCAKRIQANHRFALTGTPIENDIEELWSIFHVVFPDLFQGLKEFSNLTRKTIARRTRPFLLRRIKEEVLSELPEKMESRETVELLPDQKKLYAAYLAKLRHDTLKHLDKDTLQKNRIKILAGLTRLRQICCHPALFVDGYKGSSGKFEQLMQIIAESKNAGRRVLIFSQFTKMLNLIGRKLAEIGEPYFYLDGHTPSIERIEMCNRFNNGERDLFLISLKAGGTGLNLTGADTVILYDTWWNPAVEEQAADRAHRLGQQNSVQVIKLIARGTIEEKIAELQEKKRQLIDEIINQDEHSSSSLTEEDIREILMI